jgi:CO dehydrogenase maturation factor
VSTVLAIMGKGGAGKTVLSALITRTLLDRGEKPLLLVDADPTGGLAFAVGADIDKTVGAAREKLIRDASRRDTDRGSVVQQIDWLILEALQEYGAYSLLSMGRTDTKGCYCPVNSILRAAIEKLAAGFRFVILDAEAGIEQVNRQVVGRVDVPIVVTDGSRRGRQAAGLVAGLLSKYKFGRKRPGLVLNRTEDLAGGLPEDLDYWGTIPDDQEVRRFDQQGRSLLDLPGDCAALDAVKKILGDHLFE